jgi:5-methylcytosine-specific restriction enzyme B
VSDSMVDRLTRAFASTQGAHGGHDIDLAALARLIDRFKERYGSFADQRYLDDERTYKLMAAERMRERLGQETLGALMAEGRLEEAKTAILQSCQGTFTINAGLRQQNNLLNQWDLRPLLDAPADELAHRLYDLLYGGAPFAERFDPWVALLSAAKPGVWPAATYFLMLHDPAQHIYVKPTPFQQFLKDVAGDDTWQTRPDAVAYERLRQLGEGLLEALREIGARDMIDVQSFIWLSGRVEEETPALEIEDQNAGELLTQQPATLSSLAEWRASVESTHPVVQQAVAEYPEWLLQTFGDAIRLRFYRKQELGVFVNGRWRHYVAFNRVRGMYALVAGLGDDDLSLLRENLSRPETLKPREYASTIGYRFFISTPDDYALLKRVMMNSLGRPIAPLPDPLDGPAFVIIHGGDDGQQQYGKAYTFTLDAGGAPRRLFNAAREWSSGNGGPLYLIIYRPSPYRSYTGWARVTEFADTGERDRDKPRYVLRYDFQPFQREVDPKSLTAQISWLQSGLLTAVRGISIRQITSDEFSTIVRAGSAGGPMSVADAAFTILRQAGGGPLGLKEILERGQQRQILDEQLTLSVLDIGLKRDDRFSELGGNMWILADARVFKSRIYAGSDAAFWRIHFPREHWDEARKNNILGVGFVENPNSQSMTRYRRIRVGDRIVAYVQGGVIGGIGIVTRTYQEDNPTSESDSTLFGGSYQRRIGVAWADAPATPVSIYDQLNSEEHKDLYNRIRNPHTVMPLSRDDYTTLLSLLQVDDAGQPAAISRLPNVWTQLSSYLSLARSLGTASHTAEGLVAVARTIDPPPAEPLDADDLVTELLQLRLIQPVDANSYCARPYATGDDAVLLRLCALALLVPLEGSAEQYFLPARAIFPRLRTEEDPQPAERFAPELNAADSLTLAGWYAEAGLIDADGTSWMPLPDALSPVQGDDLASTTYNQLLHALIDDSTGTLVSDLPHVSADASLPHVEDLDDRLRKLGQDLLFDSAVVRRIYRSLLAGRHVVLSGPPGTGKTELARRLPSLLWREPAQSFRRLTLSLEQPPVEEVTVQRNGYAPVVVTATEDWGVRDVVGGIGPRLDGQSGALGYTIEHGALTRTVLQHYDETSDGRRLPAQATGFVRRDYRPNPRERYRGAWLVIDEFTRAPIDAAFGSLLTTLSGGQRATLAVPTRDGELREVPLPRDFRIIGTLNSFDRHFLNQLSEAMKRRFDFIDVLPPPPSYGDFEQGIATKEALRRLYDDGFGAIERTADPLTFRWPGILRVEPVVDAQGLARYHYRAESEAAEAAMASFWRLFSAIRVFRQLGTAQIIAVYLNLLTGVRVGMAWDEALDTALADALADQLQVLSRDEQRTVDALVEHAGQPPEFASALRAIVHDMPSGRRAAYLYALRERDAAVNEHSDIAVREDTLLTDTQITRVFAVVEPLALPKLGIFRRRLRDLIGERGL